MQATVTLTNAIDNDRKNSTVAWDSWDISLMLTCQPNEDRQDIK
jgi:hypothetical protein